MPHDPKDELIDPSQAENMNMLAKTLDLVFNGPKDSPTYERKTGFFLLVFPFGQPEGEHRSNYISNAVREDIIATMKEIVARFEGRVANNDGSKSN